MSTRALLLRAREMVPPLLEHMHKGQQGRVAVMGGSEDYTGAPFFSANAAAILGADMIHVVCEPQAAQVIKTYSPNIMVHPYMRQSHHAPEGAKAEDFIRPITDFLNRVHALVVGPGLGRDPLMQELARESIRAAREKNLGVVIDADGLLLVQKEPKLVEGYRNAILTPNVVEFSRLADSLGVTLQKGEGGENCQALAKRLGGVTVVQKGRVDWISDGERTEKCAVRGGFKRSGGQGDTLSGCLGTMLAWRKAYLDKIWDHDGKLKENELVFLAAFGSATLTRYCSRKAFEQKGRSMQASDLPLNLAEAFHTFFEKDLPDEETLLGE